MPEPTIYRVLAGQHGEVDDDLSLSVGREGPRVAVELKRPTDYFTLAPGVARTLAELLTLCAEVAENEPS